MAARRRTTLGNVSAATLNARAGAASTQQRASLAPNKRPSISGQRNGRFSVASAGAGRPSLNASFARSVHALRPSIATTGGRKSSAGVRRSGAHSNGATKQDPRPVSDKAYVNASIRALAEYLTDHGYEHPISMKILSRPSGRDFNNIMSFLFRQVDPHWQLANGSRFEEEVIPMLKALRYPFTVSKASLQAVGAPQTWPKMLAVASWIVELLCYDQEAMAHELELQERRANGETDADLDVGANDPSLDDRAFFGYLGRAYRCFLDGDDDKYAALEQELIGTYETQSTQAEAEATELGARNDELHRQIAEIKNRTDVLPGLRQRLDDLCSDQGKFEQLVEQLLAHRATLAAKLESRAADEVKLKAELNELSTQVTALRERVAGQELSAEDVARMARERQRLREAKSSATEQRAAAQSRVCEAEAALAAKLDALEVAAHSYGARAAALQLVPATAKNASGVDFEVLVNRAAALRANPASGDVEPLLSNDVRGVVRPALTVLKTAVTTRVQEARQELLELLDAEESSEEELAELVEQNSALDGRVRRAEDQYRRDKEAADAAAAAAAEQATVLEERLSSMPTQEDAERRIGRLMREATQLRAAAEAQQERLVKEREALHVEVVDALGMCTDHKEAVQQLLAELREVAEQVRSAIVESEDPVAAVLAAPLSALDTPVSTLMADVSFIASTGGAAAATAATAAEHDTSALGFEFASLASSLLVEKAERGVANMDELAASLSGMKLDRPMSATPAIPATLD